MRHVISRGHGARARCVARRKGAPIILVIGK
jgi:hypothetical protein